MMFPYHFCLSFNCHVYGFCFVKGNQFEYKGATYHVVKESFTWDEAEGNCKERFGGHLATVTSKPMNDYIADQYLKR